MSGGWSTTPPRADETRTPSRAPWWWSLGLLVVLLAALLVWRTWTGSPPVALPTASLSTDPTGSAPGSSASPEPLPSLMPSPGLTSTSNVEPGPTPPGQDTVFDAGGAQALFVTAEQISGALSPDLGQIVPSTTPAPAWGLPAGGAVIPASCQAARTVVVQPPASYEARDWTGDALTFRQEVTLLDATSTAHRAFATLVGTVDACAQYTEVDPVAGPGRWTTQPAVEGQGLYPSLVQQVTFEGPSATTNGYRGHLLVGNAIVTWTVWTTNDVETLGSPDGLAGIVQDRALAAVRAAG